MIRDDYIIASVFKYLENNFTTYPIHWPHQESGARDAEWIEPYVDVSRTPSSVEYGRVILEINIFRTETADTYGIWSCSSILAVLFSRAQVQINDWPDGGANVLGCIRMFDPVLTYLGNIPAGGGARAGLQQINLKIEGALIGA